MDQPVPERISLSEFLDWENQQSERYEWFDGSVVQLAGVSDDHSAISSNLNRIIGSKLREGPCFVRGSDRKLVPHDKRGTALGSFYADIFVSCSSEDRKGSAAHLPTVVIEILSDHGNGEFTTKRDAYMGSAKCQEYVIVDSTRQNAFRYSWTGDRKLSIAEYYRGPLLLTSLDLILTFEDIYARTNVPFALHPIRPDDEQTIISE